MRFLEVVKVFEFQRVSLALRMVACHLLHTHMLHVCPIEVVVHDSRSTVLKSPHFGGQPLVTMQRGHWVLYIKAGKCLARETPLDHNIGGRSPSPATLLEWSTCS
jgi:hypothetical protein